MMTWKVKCDGELHQLRLDHRSLCNSIIYYWLIISVLVSAVVSQSRMSREERTSLRDEVKEMFYHAYDSYMSQAYPADELMPLSCRGRYRDVEPNRGDVDDALGNFSLTLVDSLDSLVVFGNYSEFEMAVMRVIRDVKFDSDIVVSVFETNIRMLGGLLSGHILADYLKDKHNLMKWYNGQLLVLGKELGYRLLPAFNTSTGIPHPRINLKYGLDSPKLGPGRETCTSCAGTMILEFAALSRLTGEPIFELKARKAMDYLWQQRHRTSDLVGTVLNIHNGDWIRRESGVGAGIDSYYEYCLKAYILLGDELYLDRFNRHYAGVMKYVSQGPLLVDVHMHRPHSQAKNYMDALLAFWPGLQVLKGDIRPAIETHEVLYQVMRRHKFLPEAFTTDFQVHWGNYFLRPEFIESTYFLHKATGDDYYLNVGKYLVRSIQNYTRVKCGFAAVKDVRTGFHEDRMDSFVLAETFKYLYLLFADKEDVELNLDEFVFTTEGHLLPLTLSISIYKNETQNYFMDVVSESEHSRSCPNTKYLLEKSHGINYADTIRENLKGFVDNSFKWSESPPRLRSCHLPKLRASEFSASNKEHLEIVKRLGITVIVLSDGRVQLIHNSAAAANSEDAEEGARFMQEMIALSKQQIAQTEQRLRAVSFNIPNNKDEEAMTKIVLPAGPAQFGLDLVNGEETVDSTVVISEPINACRWPIANRHNINRKIAIVERGDCMFIDKARNVQRAGGVGVIVMDNAQDSSSKSSPMFAMSGDGKDDVYIPVVFLYWDDGQILLKAVHEHPSLIVTLGVQNFEGDTLQDDTSNRVESSSPQSVQSSIEHQHVGVPHVRDITDDVLGKRTRRVDIDKVMHLLSKDISQKYSNYLAKNMKNLDDKIFKELWSSVIESTMKTMQQMIELKELNLNPVVKQLLDNSLTFGEMKKTIKGWIDEYKLSQSSELCLNPLHSRVGFFRHVIGEKFCPIDKK